MGNYAIISQVSEKLVARLEEALVPSLIGDSNAIGLCSPEEKGDYQLGIHLYDIKRDGELAFSGMVNKGLRQQKYPPTVLTLYYMISAYSKSDLKFKFLEEQKILGAVMQSLSDNSILNAQELGSDAYGVDARIELLDLELEDKLKLWNDSDKGYKPSLFYKITPVELESTKTKSITRVKEFVLNLEENGG